MREIVYSKSALRTLSRIPVNVATVIRSKVLHHARDPASQANNVKTLRGQPGVYRLRVGDWRVVFTEDSEILAILRIAPRGNAYD